MNEYILVLLILLQIKHWYIDFVNQTDEEVAHKGQYFVWKGMKHSFKHGLATAIIFFFVLELEGALLLGLIDFILHYHIDYCKMHYGNRDVKTKAFWTQLGLDQMGHQLTYIGLVSLLII
jgi:hypothetical protein